MKKNLCGRSDWYYRLTYYLILKSLTPTSDHKTRKHPAKPRAIVLLYSVDRNDEQKAVNVPILGKVTAGQPITAIQNVEDYFPIPEQLAGYNQQVFILEVAGDSMIMVTS